MSKDSGESKAGRISAIVVLVCSVLMATLRLYQCADRVGAFDDLRGGSDTTIDSGGTSFGGTSGKDSSGKDSSSKDTSKKDFSNINTKNAPVPYEEIAVTDMERPPSGVFEGAARGSVQCFLVVTNATQDVLDFTASFVYEDAEGKELGKSEDYTYCVMPDDSAVLSARYYDSNKNLARTTYSIAPAHPAADRTPLKGDFTIQLVDKKPDELTLKYTSTGSATEVLNGTIWLARDGDGYLVACDGHAQEGSVEPNQSTKLTYAKGGLFDYDSFTEWNDYSDWACYINGYAEGGEDDSTKSSDKGTTKDTSDSKDIAAAEGLPASSESSTNKDGYVPYDVLVAQSDSDRFEGEFEGAGPGIYHGYLLVKNASDESMQLTADFTYYNTNDSLIGTGTNNEFCVGPGQTAVLRSGYVDSDHKLARSAYKLRALHAGESTADKYEVEELETKEDELKIKVTNTSDKTLSFFSGPQWWGTDSAGKVAAGVGEFANDKTELKPGESVDVLFKRDKILDKDTFGAWEDYKRTYCLLGRANNPE